MAISALLETHTTDILANVGAILSHVPDGANAPGPPQGGAAAELTCRAPAKKHAAARGTQEALPEVGRVLALLPDSLAAPPEATVFHVAGAEPAFA